MRKELVAGAGSSAVERHLEIQPSVCVKTGNPRKHLVSVHRTGATGGSCTAQCRRLIYPPLPYAELAGMGCSVVKYPMTLFKKGR